MSVREEDRQKSSCSGRGLGLAAAAVGVGVGAALYCFFSKRPENPHNEGSTSDWNCERPGTFHPRMDSMEDSYTTVSEYDTTDTSINLSISSEDTVDSESDTDSTSESEESFDSETYMTSSSNMSYDNSAESDMSFDELNSDSLDDRELDLSDMAFDSPGQITSHYSSRTNMAQEGYVDEYDITRTMHQALADLKRLFVLSASKTEEEQKQLENLRQQAFRERSWTLEECSICFDVMLRNHEVMRLPCAHNFHTDCILPWLQEKQTCPVCRKPVE